MNGGLLCGQVAFEGVANLPLLVSGFGLRLASIGHLESGIACPVEPEEEIVEEVVCDWYCVDGGVFEGVVNEGVFLEECV